MSERNIEEILDSAIEAARQKAPKVGKNPEYVFKNILIFVQRRKSLTKQEHKLVSQNRLDAFLTPVDMQLQKFAKAAAVL